MEIIVLWIILGVIFAAIGFAVGDAGRKNNGGAGAVLGGLLGPIGVLIAAVMPSSEKDQSLTTATGKPVKDRIAELENELASLQSGKQSADADPTSIDDDGIPTYKLD